jgi:hypothetical protein
MALMHYFRMDGLCLVILLPFNPYIYITRFDL